MDTYFEVAASDEMLFGQGINVVNGQVATYAVVPIVSGLGASTLVPDSVNQIYVAVVKDSSSYQSMYSDVGSISGSGLVDSASASVSYLRDQTASATSISYVATRIVKSQTSTVNLSKARVDPTALAFLASNGPDAFAARYGTHFISGFTYGGSFIGRYRLATSSATDKESLAVSMTASIEGFGVKASISNDFSSGLQTATTHYDQSAEAYVTGRGAITINTQNPDDIVSACDSYSPSTNPDGTIGNRLTAVCDSWEVLPDIQAALQALGKTGALSQAVSPSVMNVLRQEYVQLDYINGTCAAMLLSGSYVLPFHQGVLENLQSQASAAQQRLEQMTLSQLAALDDDGARALCVSGGLNSTLAPVSHCLISVSATWVADGGFYNGGSFSSSLQLGFSSSDTQLASLQHTRDGYGSDDQQYIHYSFRLFQDTNGPCLQAHLV